MHGKKPLDKDYSYRMGHQYGYEFHGLVDGLPDESVSSAADITANSLHPSFILDDDRFSEGYVEGYFHREGDVHGENDTPSSRATL